jgi:hypothetical protein
VALKAKPAGIFLGIVATIIVIVVGGFLWVQANPTTALRIAFTPSETFTAISQEKLDYSDDGNWAALPTKDSFANQGASPSAQTAQVDVFFVHPTTYLSRDSWNAPLDHADANMRVEKRVLKMQASAFNQAGKIYAPRYRQATFGAFFDQEGDGLQALIYAYQDVENAFDQFVAERNQGRPFILAGHSQGSLHLLTLLKAKIAGTPLAERMVATYIIGWPVSIEADLGALDGINACASPQDTHCVISYQTFGPNGDTSPLKTYFETTVGLGDTPRKGTTMLCTNPLTWTIGGEADANLNLGAQPPAEDDAPIGKPVPSFIGAHCKGDGYLYLKNEPGTAWQDMKMAGENYHVYDYHMFYQNIRANAVDRAHNYLMAP